MKCKIIGAFHCILFENYRYEEGSNPNCGMPLCCRDKKGLKQNQTGAGMFGGI